MIEYNSWQIDIHAFIIFIPLHVLSCYEMSNASLDLFRLGSEQCNHLRHPYDKFVVLTILFGLHDSYNLTVDDGAALFLN